MQDFLPQGFPAELNVLCSTGPMTRSLRDMDLYMHIMVSSKQYLHDPRIIPFPWSGLSTPLPSKPIKLGIMLNDGVITPQPPVLRTLKWAQEKLSTNSNFILKPFTPHNAAEAMKLIGEMYWPDMGLGTKQALSKTGEPMHSLTKTVLSPVTSDFTSSCGPEREKTATQVSSQRLARDAFRDAFVASFNAQDVDFVLAPCFVGPASKHDTAYYWNYTALWNFVDYPGAVFPTGLATEKGERYAEDYTPLSEKCKHVQELWGKDGEGFEGAPLDLQLVGRRYHDNDLFGALGEVQKVLGFA